MFVSPIIDAAMKAGASSQANITYTAIFTMFFITAAVILLSPFAGAFRGAPTNGTHKRKRGSVTTYTLNLCKSNLASRNSTTPIMRTANEIQDMDITAASISNTTSMRKMLDEISIMFEERTAYVRKFLDDFSQPLFMSLVDDDDSGVQDETINRGDDESETVVIGSFHPKIEPRLQAISHNVAGNRSHNETSSNERSMTHFCFLVHGYNGVRRNACI